MANRNFVVHNGLTVGPLTIDATTGDIQTPGNIAISGNIGVSAIYKNDSSVFIDDTGSGSSVVFTLDGTPETTIDADGVKLISGDAFYINSTSVLDATTLGSGVVNSSLTAVGNLVAVSVAGNATIYGNVDVGTDLNITGVGYIGPALIATVDDATALSIALGG